MTRDLKRELRRPALELLLGDPNFYLSFNQSGSVVNDSPKGPQTQKAEIMEPNSSQSGQTDEAVSADAAMTRARISDVSQVPSVFRLESNLEWMVAGLIAKASVNLISAESGTGKSWLGYFIAGRVAHGLDVLGRAVRKAKVLYCDGENPLFTVKERLTDLGVEDTDDLKIWGGWNDSPPPPPSSQIVIDFARREQGLIIYDSLLEFHTGSEQDSTETRQYMRYYRVLANLGATVVVLGHSGKAETAKQYRGSSDIKAAVDTAYKLETVSENNGKLGRLSLKCFKGRLAPGQDCGLEFVTGKGFVPFPLEDSLMKPVGMSVDDVIADILATKKWINQKTVVALAKVRGISRNKVTECLSKDIWAKRSGTGSEILYGLRSDAVYDELVAAEEGFFEDVTI